ncbi:sensor histidine kinase [Actinomadura sp. 3N407]|uniref:sensor histidine kinase n=1 Tax=Actinomadura sp. 3N407 TaxID=3457423 RepID=UPI003FCE8EA5
MSEGTERPGSFLQRTVDRLVAIAGYPVTVVLTLMPGGLEEDGGVLRRSESPSLVFRHFPELLVDAPHGIWPVVDHWAAGLAFFVLIPAVTAWTLLYRRTRPGRTLAVAVVSLLLFANIAPIAVALYSHAAWFTDRRRLAGWTAAAAIAFIAGLGSAALTWSAAAFGLVAFAVPVSLGLWTGTRRRLVATMRDRAERLEREQRLMTERATIAERARIAREMHDVVAHRVSLMVLQAGGLEVSVSDPDVAESIGRIRATGREALGDLREVLGVLRDEFDPRAPTAPQPGLTDLPLLVDDCRSAGMAVQYEKTGTVRELPARLQRAAYRVAQEALTNAGKHAPASPVRLTLEYRPEAFSVTVHNTGSARPGELPTSGYGLAGLRERVALAGGELDAGPLPDGDWRVRAVFPDATGGPAPRSPDSGRAPAEEPS